MEKDETVHHTESAGEDFKKPTETKVITGNTAFQEAKLKEPPTAFTARTCLLYAACLVCFLCSTVNGYDGSLMNSLLENDHFLKTYQIDNKGLWTGIVSSMYTIGGVVALPFVGPIVDQLGRRAGMFSGAFLIILGTIIQGVDIYNPNRAQFMGGRFLLGFGNSLLTTGGPILVMEISHPVYRGVVTALYNVCWFTGSIIASGAARGALNLGGNASWLVIIWLQALFSGIIIVFVWFLPESPRWLYTRGHHEKCRKMLTYWHGNDNPESVWVTLQMAEYEEHLEMNGADKRYWDYSALFRNRASVYRLSCNLMIAVFGQWAGNSVLSYFLGAALETAGYKTPLQQMNITLIINCVQFVAAIVGGFSVDFVGRRVLLLFANIGCSVVWIAMTVSTAVFANSGQTNAAAGRSALAMIYLFDIIFSIGFTPLQALYPVEVLSFEQRAKGMAFSSFVMNLAMLLNNYAWPISLKEIAWKTYIIFAVWCAFQATAIYFVIPETRHRTLEELDDIFNAPNPRKASTEKKKIALDADHHILEIEPVRKSV